MSPICEVFFSNLHCAMQQQVKWKLMGSKQSTLINEANLSVQTFVFVDNFHFTLGGSEKIRQTIQFYANFSDFILFIILCFVWCLSFEEQKVFETSVNVRLRQGSHNEKWIFIKLCKVQESPWKLIEFWAFVKANFRCSESFIDRQLRNTSTQSFWNSSHHWTTWKFNKDTFDLFVIEIVQARRSRRETWNAQQTEPAIDLLIINLNETR